MLPNDLVRCFAFTLQSKTLLALTANDRRHVAIVKDKKMQYRLQKHHERQQVRRMHPGESWMSEGYTLPSGFRTQVVTYKSDEDAIRSLCRFQPEEVILLEEWYGDGFPDSISQRIQGVTDGISYEATRMRGADDQIITTMKLSLHAHGKWLASVCINDDTCEAYKFAYHRIKTLQELCE